MRVDIVPSDFQAYFLQAMFYNFIVRDLLAIFSSNRSRATTTMAGPSDLPVELVWEIFKLAARSHSQTALSLARTSRAVNEEILPFAYEVVSLHPRPGEGIQARADRFRATITMYPERADWVKILFHRPSRENTNVDIISSCRRVHQLHLMQDIPFPNFVTAYDDGADLSINVASRLLEIDSLQSPLFQKVTHLVLQDNIPKYPLVSNILRLPCLTHVSMGFSQCERNALPQEAVFATVHKLLGNRALKLVHLYFRADLLKICVNSHFVDMMRHLIPLDDIRLYVGLGRRWGGWREWSEYHRQGRDLWEEIIIDCATWRRDVCNNTWVYGQSAEPAYL